MRQYEYESIERFIMKGINFIVFKYNTNENHHYPKYHGLSFNIFCSCYCFWYSKKRGRISTILNLFRFCWLDSVVFWLSILSDDVMIFVLFLLNPCFLVFLRFLFQQNPFFYLSRFLYNSVKLWKRGTWKISFFSPLDFSTTTTVDKNPIFLLLISSQTIKI